MASVEGLAVMGEYMHPVIDLNTKIDDPWQRNYYQPPPFGNLVPRKFPLIDIRDRLSTPEYAPANLLQSHGFCLAKHHSEFLDKGHEKEEGELDEQGLNDVYYDEMTELVKEVTGAKTVFILTSVFRKGQKTTQPYKLPVKVTLQKDRDETKSTDKPVVAVAKPVRVPHLDFTPLGARQTLRSLRQDIYTTANESGIISREDKICEGQGFKAESHEANVLIAEEYNQNGELGPRYAAFSIWRPTKKVERDPMTLAPRKETPVADGEMVHWCYENKVPGASELGGDFLKEYAMLGVKSEDQAAAGDGGSLKWYYASGQDSTEVLFIKLFDSASLGTDATHAAAPWHASPEMEAFDGTEARESIELRVLAFW